MVWIFASLNICIGTWVLYIPYVKQTLALTDAQIGFALFCIAFGIITFLSIVPYLSKLFGLGRLVFFGIVFFSFSFLFPLFMPTYITLCISLFIVGVFSGITDIAMNALISELEIKDNVTIMSAAHGFFSLGGFVGAALGSLLMPFFTHPFYHMLSVFVVVVLVNLWFRKHYFLISEEQKTKGKNVFTLKHLQPLLPIAFVAFVIMSSEGAIEHWSSLYFIEIVKIENQYLAGVGFIMFSVMMTFGRFFGDGISAKIGSLKIILLGCTMAILGYILVLSSQFYVTILGFSTLGLGLSVVIPEVFRIAGKIKGVKASVGMSVVSGIGMLGFLIGPVFLGYISNSFNLKISFFVLLLLTFFAVLLTSFKLKAK